MSCPDGSAAQSHEDKKLVNNKIEAIRKRIQENRFVSLKSCYYAIGRGYVELSNFEQARVHLQKAWDQDIEPPENAYALGFTLGQLYQQQLEAAQRIEIARKKKRIWKNSNEIRARALLNYLRKSEGLHPALQENVAGLNELYEENIRKLWKSKKCAAKIMVVWGENWMRMFSNGSRIKRITIEAIIIVPQNIIQKPENLMNAPQVARSEPSLYESDCCDGLKPWFEISRGVRLNKKQWIKDY